MIYIGWKFQEMGQVTQAERDYMDYVVAGVAAVLIFIYLIYALLKPERF